MTRIVHIVYRAAASLYLLGHSFTTRQAALVPELKREPNEVVAPILQHRRYGRRIDPSGHGDGDRVVVDGVHLFSMTG